MSQQAEVMAEYIREDLAELGKPHRKDERIILADLRWCFRAYARALRPAKDWSAVK